MCQNGLDCADNHVRQEQVRHNEKKNQTKMDFTKTNHKHDKSLTLSTTLQINEKKKFNNTYCFDSVVE